MAPKHLNQRLSKKLPYHRNQANGDPYADATPPFKETDPRGKASLELLNENSPLLAPQRLEDDSSPLDSSPLDSDSSVDELDFLEGEEQQESKSVWYLFVLTLSIGG